MRETILQTVAVLSQALLKTKVMVVTAESCTGGMVAEALTALPGSSAWFERAFICYSYDSKYEMLGVRPIIIQEHGSVSRQCVEEMAVGALQNAHGKLAVAISGIAGPDGSTIDKPVGTVWIAWAGQHMSVVSQCFHFSGNRHAVREQATLASLVGMLDRLQHIN
jgi:nicotinamide-nucleotide amidase